VQALLVALLVILAGVAPAHEIPENVRVTMYVSKAPQQLELLLRVPLAAMRDIKFAQRGPGYLDFAAASDQLDDAVSLWLTGNLQFDQDGEVLPPPQLRAARLALPSDLSFAGIESARESFNAPPLPPNTELYWEQALLDVHLTLDVDSAGGEIFLTPTLARLGLRTVLDIRYLEPPQPLRQMVVVGDPGRLALVPAAGSVFRSFARAGFEHVLAGIDHLLFLAALLLPVRRLRPLVLIVTAFTLAHSLTLTAAVLDMVSVAAWFIPAVELLVAASIVYLALENILLPATRRRWLIAYGFGLVHGFAFSFALREQLQFAGDYLPVALLAFNLGIEAGQLLVVVVALLLLTGLLRLLPEKPTIIVLSALIAHSGLHWLSDRFEILQQYAFSWPQWNAATMLLVSRWLTLIVIAAGVAWLAQLAVQRFAPAEGR
jgi:hypothetical protein